MIWLTFAQSIFNSETTDKILKQKLPTLIYTFLVEENAVLFSKIQSAESERKDSWCPKFETGTKSQMSSKRKFRTEKPCMLGTKVQNLVAQATWHPALVYTKCYVEKTKHLIVDQN